MTDPGDQLPAGGRDRAHLRASHAARERATEQLKVAFVQGRLDKDEFDARVDRALTARTFTELAAVIADLPAEPPAARPPEPAGVQEERVLRPGAVLAAATAVYAGTWLLAFFLPRTSEGEPMAGANLVVAATFAYSVVLVFAVGRILTGWQERRSAGKLPGGPAPGPGNQQSQRSSTAGPGGQLPWADHGQQHTTEAARHDPAAHPRSPGSRSAHYRRHRHRYTAGHADA